MSSSLALRDVIMFVSKYYWIILLEINHRGLFQSVVSAGWPQRRLSTGSGLRGKLSQTLNSKLLVL